MIRVALLLFLLSEVAVSSAVQITLLATNISLPAPWVYAVDADSPEGSWKTPWGTQSSVSATVSLGQVLAPGNYAAYIKALDFDHGTSNLFRMAGVTSPLNVLDDRDANTIYWSTNVNITTTTSTSEIMVDFFRPTGGIQDVRWFALYVTSDTNEIVLRDDRALSFVYPATADNDNSAANPGNRFPNSSFECNIGPMWRLIRSGREESLRNMRSTDFAWHGSYSFRFPCPEPTGVYGAQSNPIFLASNKVHTVSVYARSSNGNNTATMRINSVYAAPLGYRETYTTNASSTVGTTWTRLTVTTTNLPVYPNNQYSISIECQKVDGGHVYFDGLQVEEGTTATAWAPKLDFEFEPSLSDWTQIVYTNQYATVDLQGWNNSAGSLIKQIAWSVRNWTNGVSWSGVTNLTVLSSNLATVSLVIPTNELGYFRGTFSITNQPSDTEVVWDVVAPPVVLGTNSYFGGHMNANTNPIFRATKMGVEYQRGLSLGRVRWKDVETSDNVFVWPDLSAYTNFGVKVMICLLEGGEGDRIPAWISPLTSYTNYLGRFCSNAVLQYTNIAWAYEIGNEPDQDSVAFPTVAHYADCVRICSSIIKAIDPRLLVVAFGGIQSYNQVTNYWQHITAAGVTNKIDYGSVHEYPGNEVSAQSLSAFTAVPLWNSESGFGDKGGYTGRRYNFRTAGRYVVRWKSADYAYDSLYSGTEAIAKNFLTCMGWMPKSKQFYYDTGQRNITVEDLNTRQFTWTDADDSVKAKGAAISAMARILGYFTNAQHLTVTNAEAFVFNGTTPVMALWAGSNITVTLAGSVSASNLRVHDMMGNGATPASLTLHLGKMPVLITSTATLSNTCHAITNAVIVSRADTLAPQLHLTYTSYPGEITPHYRWFAIDDSGVPTEDNGARIEYAWRTNETWSAWSGDTYLHTDVPVIQVKVRDQAGNEATSFAPPTSGTRGLPLRNIRLK